MAREEIEVEGTVLAVAGHGFYTVELGNGCVVEATLGSSLRIKKKANKGKKPPLVLPMDLVLIILSPVDLARGRISALITPRGRH